MKARAARALFSVPLTGFSWSLALFCFQTFTVFASPSIQPYVSYWFPNQLLTWSPETDPDAAYNRGNVLLASRFLNPNLNVNLHARANEARISPLVAFGPTSFNPSQGSLAMRYYAVNYWQYMDVMVFWGGSAGEGLLLAPNPTVIDASHRNGVRILGNIFFPPNVYGGQLQWVRDLVQTNAAGAYPVADKMIEAAHYYGFDGWFINQETSGGNTALAAQMREFMRYIKTNSNVIIMWYDSMTQSGSISYQNALTSNNQQFFESSGHISDYMFLNFNWTPVGTMNSRTLAQTLGRSPYDLYAGVDVEANGYGTTVDWQGIFPESQPHVLSLGFYRPEWTYNSSTNNADFYARDNRFWVGPNGDPSNTVTPGLWNGVAHYVPALSPINRVPFVTSFNTGHGNRYAINGQIARLGEWNDLSAQDVLPTWRWLVSAVGPKLVPQFDWNDAYYGGTSLKISGALLTTNDVKLFMTQLPIATNSNLRVAFKTGINAMDTLMQVGLAFEDDPTSFQFLDIGATASAAWDSRTFNLQSLAGKTLSVLSLRFASPNIITNYAIWLGQIAIYNDPISEPTPPTALLVDRASIGFSTAALGLKWTHSSSPIYYYNVYRRNPDNTLTWLGTTPNNAWYVPQIRRVALESITQIEVEVVAPDFGQSSHALATFQWPPQQLVAHYEFEGDATDTSGHGYDGTLFGNASFTTGKIGSLALSLDGLNSYVQVPASISDDFTVALWVKTSSSGAMGQWWAGKGLVDGEVPGAANDFGTALVGTNFGFGVGNPDTTILSTNTISDGPWHHLAATRDSSTGQMKIYVDGLIQSATNGPTGPRSAPPALRIGSIQTGGTSGFLAGAMDDVRFYNYPLNELEIVGLSLLINKVVVNSDGTKVIVWSAVRDRTYRLLYKSLLSDSAWLQIGGDVVASDATASQNDPSNLEAQRFYRVQLVQ